VRCQIPAGAAELQIGGAEIADNLAFLPVEVRNAADTDGNSTVRVKMGLVRENDNWKLLSVGLLLLDLPALAFEWDAAEMDSTERAAIDGVKKIAEGVETYRRTYARLPDSLAKLAPPKIGAAADPDAAGLLDAELASGVRNGYKFRYVISGASTLGAPAKYEIAATPEIYGRTGRRSFFRDLSGNPCAASPLTYRRGSRPSGLPTSISGHKMNARPSIVLRRCFQQASATCGSLDAQGDLECQTRPLTGVARPAIRSF
jgi:hypothetical protein